MSIEAQKRQGGRLLIENILAENTAAALTLTANGDYVQISGNYENGDIIHIAEPAELAGDYTVTQYDGATDLGFKSLFGLVADDLSGVSAVTGYKLDMLPACWGTDFNRNLGSWNTESITNGCGQTITLSSSFERGTLDLSFYQNWTIDLQNAIKDRFQENAPSLAIAYEPLGIDENGQAVQLGIQELSRALITGIDLSDPNDGVATGTINGTFVSKVVTARIA